MHSSEVGGGGGSLQIDRGHGRLWDRCRSLHCASATTFAAKLMCSACVSPLFPLVVQCRTSSEEQCAWLARPCLTAPRQHSARSSTSSILHTNPTHLALVHLTLNHSTQHGFDCRHRHLHEQRQRKRRGQSSTVGCNASRLLSTRQTGSTRVPIHDGGTSA